MSLDDRLRTHPKERLAAPYQRVDLAAASARLRAEPHAPTSGHRQVALVRRGPVAIILFVFEADGALKDHRTEGEVTVHVLSGRLAVTIEHDEEVLGAGEFISMAPGEMHSVRALEECEMLLTVCQVPAESDDAPPP